MCDARVLVWVRERDSCLPISSLGLLALHNINFSIIFRNATRRVVVLTELVKCSRLMAYGGSSRYGGLHANVTYAEIINCTGPLTHCNSCQNYNGPNRFYVSENNREVDWLVVIAKSRYVPRITILDARAQCEASPTRGRGEEMPSPLGYRSASATYSAH